MHNEEELIAFWKLLEENNVKYLLIGGFATGLHGYTRMTKDIDFWIQDSVENRKNLGVVLEELGIAPKEIIERMQFVAGYSMMNLPSGFPLDIMTKVKGLETEKFDSYFSEAKVALIDGVRVWIIDIKHLIDSKKAAGRPKDLIDIEELEKIMRK